MVAISFVGSQFSFDYLINYQLSYSTAFNENLNNLFSLQRGEICFLGARVEYSYLFNEDLTSLIIFGN